MMHRIMLAAALLATPTLVVAAQPSRAVSSTQQADTTKKAPAKKPAGKKKGAAKPAAKPAAKDTTKKN